MHKTPALTITPESTALAGVGAMGCAMGSQPCMGNIPALVPKPIMQMNRAIKNKGDGLCTSPASSEPPARKAGLTVCSVR